MESMFDRTLSAFSLAITANMLTIDLATAELIPMVRTIPKSALPVIESAKDIFNVANRLGKAFAEHSVEEIIKITEVVF